MIECSKGVKKNKYTCLTYEEFKNIQKIIINTTNNNMNVNVLEELINSLNKIDIEENNGYLYQKEELSEDEELNIINDDIEDNHINNENDKEAY